MEQAGSQTTNKHAEVVAWLHRNGKTILLALDALLVLAFVFLVASWMVFKVRSASLLTMADQIGSSAREERPADTKRTAVGAEAGNPRQGLANDSSAQTTTSTLSDAGGFAERARSDRMSHGGGSEDAKRAEQFARLERRALFGEPRLSVHIPQVEAIFGDAAMLDGRWVERGGKAGEFTLVDLKPDRVVVADADGDTRSLVMTAPAQGLAMVRSSDFARFFERKGGESSFDNRGKSKPSKKEKWSKEQDGSWPASGKQANKEQKIFEKLAQIAESGLDPGKNLVKKLSANENPQDSRSNADTGGKKIKEPLSEGGNRDGKKGSHSPGAPNPPKKGQSKKSKFRR